MRISTADAARKLGMSVPELLDAMTSLVGDLSEVWPEMDEGYVDTIRQLHGLHILKTQGEEPDPELGKRSPAAQESSDLSATEQARCRILDKLERAGRWGGNSVSWDTLRNHFCQGVQDLEGGLEQLIDEGLVIVGGKGSKRKGPFSLNPSRKGEIEEEVARLRA